MGPVWVIATRFTFTTTMGPGIPVDPTKTRGFFDEEGAPVA